MVGTVGKRIVIVFIGLAASGPMLWAVEPGAIPADKADKSSPGPSRTTGLLVATSADGRLFKPTGEVFAAGAGGVDLLRLPGGEILALIERASVSGERPAGPSSSEAVPVRKEEPQGIPVELAVSRSNDAGKTWTSPRPIRLNLDKDRGAAAILGGTLARTSNQAVRLYYLRAATGADQSRSTDKPGIEVASAVTRNGLDFEVDDKFEIEVLIDGPARLVAATAGSRVHLFVAHLNARTNGREGRVDHFASTDGQRFERAEDPRRPTFRQLADLEQTRRGLRAFTPSPAGLRSLISDDVRRWRPEPGVRLAGAGDAAVVELEDQTHLMLFTAELDAESSKLPPLAGRPAGAGDAAAGAGATQDPPPVAQGGEAGAPVAADPEPAPAAGTTPDSPSRGSDDAEKWAEFAPPADGWAETGFDSVAQDDPLARAPFEQDGEAGPFAPLPDFYQPVDYWAWFDARYPADVPDNAYPDYQALRQEWPTLLNPEGGLKDMLNGDHSTPIAPWNPAEHPDWEATHQTVNGFLDRFSQATWHAYYAEPFEASGDPLPGGESLLVSILLPGLAENRGWTKAALADALRQENGRVPPDHALDRIGAVFRNATLIGQAPTCIHSLVSIAEQSLAQKVARHALQHGVFSTPEELAAAYDTLSQYDLPPADAVHWLGMETASLMQLAQYVVTPTGEDGALRVDPERMKAIGPMIGGITGPPESGAAEITVEDVSYSTQMLRDYFQELAEQMHTGYPQVREADVKATAESYIEAAPLLQPLIPVFNRVHHLRARNEASRRATQLTYALHLHRAQTGAWPTSLADLPEEYGQTVRTDPFTGSYFGYQLTESGPKVYSLGEDGLDSGGVHSKTWGTDRKTPDDSDDYVFWPPQD